MLELSKCSVCSISGHKPSPYAIGACKKCREILSMDVHLLYRCTEHVLAKMGHDLDKIYANNRRQEGVTGRRLLSATVYSLTNCNSYEIMNMFRLRGREQSDSTVRHLIMSARDFYRFNKHIREEIDTIMRQTLEQYMLHDNMIKNSSLLGIDKVCEVLMSRGLIKDAALASEISLEIINALK